MTAIVLPEHLEAWAQAEVEAGRAKSVEELTAEAVAGYRHRLETFRATLDAASAEADAGLVYPAEQVVAELEALYPTES